MAYEPNKHYDADDEMLEIEADGKIFQSFRRTLYLMKSEKAKILFNSKGKMFYEAEDIYLYVSNIQKVTKVPNLKESTFGRLCLKMGMAPQKAERVMDNIRLIYVCKPTPIKGSESDKVPSGAYTCSDINQRTHEDGEIESHITSKKHTISVKLKEVIIYDNSSGDILGRFGLF